MGAAVDKAAEPHEAAGDKTPPYENTSKGLIDRAHFIVLNKTYDLTLP